MVSSDRTGMFSDRMRLVLVALGALALCGAYLWRGALSSDFWEHAAVVRELAARPTAPQHPLLQVDAPHAYASPYLLAVGLVARVTHISAIAALGFAGLVNLVLLVLAFRRLLVRLLPNGEAAAPYALLLVIFFWGKDAWMWSGFLHVGMLGYDVAYPSTFATAAMFLALSFLLDALNEDRRRPYLGIALLVAFCFITHPPTALVLFAALAALFVARLHAGTVVHAALLTGAVAAGVAASFAWPYFPVLDLFTDQPPEFHSWSSVFYQTVLPRVWPVVLALPVLLWRLRADRRDPLVLLTLLLAVIYVTGAITGAYGLGRTIASIAVVVQIALGAALAAWEFQRPAGRRWLVPAGTLAVLIGLFAYARPPLPRLLKYDPPEWREVRAILEPVRPGEVVLADSPTSYPVPAVTGGRVIAWRHPIYWVPDHAERRAAQDRFFTAVSNEDRRETLRRYDVQWVLLNRRRAHLDPAEEAALLALGCAVGQRDSLVLMDVRAGVSCAPPSRAGTSPAPIESGSTGARPGGRKQSGSWEPVATFIADYGDEDVGVYLVR
jgi:hypothetical protein